MDGFSLYHNKPLHHPQTGFMASLQGYGWRGMKYHNHYLTWMGGGEFSIIVGFTIGRTSYLPEAKYLYSLRIYVLFFKFEILWRTL